MPLSTFRLAETLSYYAPFLILLTTMMMTVVQTTTMITRISMYPAVTTRISTHATTT